MRGVIKVYVFINFLVLLPPSLAHERSLGFVIDTTASMTTDIRQIATGISHLIEHHWIKTTSVFHNFIVSPYNDPKIGPLTRTTKPVLLYNAINKLNGSGGDDCPEMFTGGVLAATHHAGAGSLLLIFTDGMVKKQSEVKEVETTLKRKNIFPIIVLTGCCNLNPCPDQIYRHLTKVTNGAFYKITKRDVHYVMEFIVAAISKDKSKLQNPPKTFNELLLFIMSEKKEVRNEAIEEVAEKECKVRRAKGVSAAEIFLIGCNRIKCTKDGYKVMEIRCDAKHGGLECKSLHQTWACDYKGLSTNCLCLKDDRGAFIKIL